MTAMTQVYVDAADAFVALAEDDEVGAAWSSDSAISGYTVGGLVAHTSIAIGWLSKLLTVPPPADGRRPITLGNYYAGMKVVRAEDLDSDIHAGLRMLGEHAAERGPDAVLERLRSTIADQREQLSVQPDDRVLDMRPTIPATITLDDFLRTRVLELVVHGDDLAASVGSEFAPPAPAAAETITTLVATAQRAHGDLAVIRALSRRERAEPVFPVF